MNRAQISHDAWTYHEFGAWSFQDEIRAAIIDDLDQSVDRDRIPSNLREQATTGTLPIVPVPLERITLEPETIDPHSIGSVSALLLTVQLDKDSDAFAYLLHRPKLATKIGNRVAREIAADLRRTLDGIRHGNAFISISGELAKILDLPGKDS